MRSSSRTTRINFCTGTGKLHANAIRPPPPPPPSLPATAARTEWTSSHCIPRLTSFARGNLD
ncbi:hypothetical protein COCVIDRAFT_104081 [Bipolaris victoriae FI3]|uniref:Uncharacterized protein n=1 Tax=Bipolaris victoriae (strain FI3) TaxID=930091 RepID=W7E478_BIPV3|nr:hypothetical protein COCVIDRAFT_104081 [Bipolaris victoriae FI3]